MTFVLEPAATSMTLALVISQVEPAPTIPSGPAHPLRTWVTMLPIAVAFTQRDGENATRGPRKLPLGRRCYR